MNEERAKHYRRHVRIFRFLRVLILPFMRLLFGFRFERIPASEGPQFVVCNHNTDLDCVFLGIAAPGQMYYVATETVARMGLLGKIVMRWFDPILHHKGSQGAATTRAILGCLKAGYSVGLFPEGNRSFNGETCPIPPATGKIARVSGATLVTYRLTGGYLSSPRWGRGIRKGKLEGRLAGVYTPEQLKKMSADEVRAAIERDLWTDAYEEQRKEPVVFRGARRAEYLEAMLFRCPACGALGSLHSKRHTLSCDQCGARMVFTEYGFLRGEDGTEKTLRDLDRAQRESLAALAEKTPEDTPLFSDELTLREVGAAHRLRGEKHVTLRAFPGRFELGGRDVPFERVDSISVVQRNRLTLHEEGGELHLELTGGKTFNALKYLYLFRIAHPSVSGTL